MAGVLCRAVLIVVAVGRHGNNRLVDRLAEESLGVALDLLQHEGRQLLGRKLVVAQADLFALSHPALGGRGGTLGIDRLLPPRRLADDDLTVRYDRDVAGKSLAAESDPLGAWNDDWAAAPQDGGSGIRRPRSIPMIGIVSASCDAERCLSPHSRRP